MRWSRVAVAALDRSVVLPAAFHILTEFSDKRRFPNGASASKRLTPGAPPVLKRLAARASERLDFRMLVGSVMIGLAAALAGALLKKIVYDHAGADHAGLDHAGLDHAGALYFVFLPFALTAAFAGGTAAGVSAILATAALVVFVFQPAPDASAVADTIAFAAASLALPGVAARLRPFFVEHRNNGMRAAKARSEMTPGRTSHEPAPTPGEEGVEPAERFAGVCPAAPGALFSFSADADGDAHACRFISEKATPLFGIDAAEVMRDARSLLNRIHTDDRASLRSSLKRSAGRLEPWQGVFRYDHPERGEISIDAHCAPACRLDGHLVWHGYACDVSGRDAGRRRIEELTLERSSAIDAMAKTLGHQINQPLTAGTVYLKVAQRLVERLPAESGAPISETIGKAVAQMMRAGDVIRSLRELVARVEPDKTLVCLNLLVEEALTLVRAQAADADIRVETSFVMHDDLVIADPAQLKQLVANLLRNAIEAMRGSALRELRISTSIRDAAIRVEISDTGRGLGGVDGARLFEPFDTASAGGMGIGLPTARAIVEAHYGRIWAKPNPGGGAIFAFELPLRDRESIS